MKSVEKQIEAKIAELEKEVVRYQAALGLIRGAKHTIVADSVGSMGAKRESKPRPRGPYKKKRKNTASVISKKFKANLPSPDWRKEVPKALQGMNPLTAREIIEKIAPGIHKKTRRVLAARCSAMLVWLRKEGLVKEVRSADGHHVAYTV